MYNNEQEAREAILSKEQAIHQINLHDISKHELFEVCGEKDSYTGEEILNFLGY